MAWLDSTATAVCAFVLMVCGGCGPTLESDSAGSTSDDAETTDASSPPSTSVSTSGVGTGDPTGSSTVSPTTAGPTTATVTSTTTSPGSTTDSTTGSSGDSSDDSVGATFIVSPDFASCSCECSVWDQDCPPGDKCVAWANDGGEDWNATRCSEVDPDPAQAGEACLVESSVVSGFDNCAHETMCLDVDPETNEGVCTSLCTGSPDAPECDDPSATCVVGNDGTINVCLPSCDPLADDCGEGQGCYAFGSTTACARTGEPISTADGFFPAWCASTTTAVAPDAGGVCDDAGLCCAAWCSLSGPEQCSMGATCQPWSDGADDLGLCLTA